MRRRLGRWLLLVAAACGVALLVGGAGVGVSLAAPPAAASPSIASLSVDHSQLSAAGGSVVVSAVVADASSCVFSVSPKLAGMPTTVACDGGSASATVTLPANTTTSAVTYAVNLQATGQVDPPATASVTVSVAGVATPTSSSVSGAQGQTGDGVQVSPSTSGAGGKPGVSITSGPSGPTASRSASFAFVIDVSPHKVADVACSLDGVAVGCQTAEASGHGRPTTAGSASFSDLGQGSHSFSVAVEVDHGKAPAPASRSWLVDVTPPVLQDMPADMQLPATDGAGATVSYTSPTATDNLDPSPSVSCSPASGTPFSVGTTTVTCTATDAAGNTTSATFAVDVYPLVQIAAGAAATITGVDAVAGVQLVIPAGAFPQGTQLSIFPAPSVAASAPNGPHGVAFTISSTAQPVTALTLSVPYDPLTNVPSDEVTLASWSSSPAEWDAAPTTYNDSQGSLVATISHFSTWMWLLSSSTKQFPLIYAGGPLMTGSDVHAIYWVPPDNTSEQQPGGVITKFFQDLGAEISATGAPNTVFGILPWYLYPFTTPPRLASTTFATQPLPQAGCTDSVAFTLTCLTDAQIRQEIDAVRAQNPTTMQGGTGNLYFIFLPQLVGVQGPLGDYAYESFCGYHYYYTSSTGAVFYAVIPFSGSTGCDTTQHPNLSPADSMISVASHEMAEMLTDPDTTSGWRDASSHHNEIGDKCSWIFGPLFGTSGQEYNQILNGDHYLLQEEWVNSTESCEASVNSPWGTGGGTPLAIATTSLAAGVVGTPYSQTLDATGGTPPYSWSVAGGALPAGLTLDSTSGLISGTPTTTGTSSFSLTVTDDVGATATTPFAITVNPGGSGVSMHAIEAPLPANTAADPTVQLAAVSCPSVGNCSAVGTYWDSAGYRRGLLLTETDGTWATAVEATLPANALQNDISPTLYALSCASPGNCTAVGWYDDTSGAVDGLLIDETNGTWSEGIEAPVAGTDSEPAVSCASAGNCAAVGFGPSSAPVILIETNGSWTAHAVSLPADASPSNPNGVLFSVSCPAVGDCSAAGTYSDGFGNVNDQGWLLSESNGSWAPGVEASLPANADTHAPAGEMGLFSISCASAGNCAATGGYTDSSGAVHPLLLNESSGTWATGIEASLPANAAPLLYPEGDWVGAVSCSSSGNCSAFGSYFDGVTQQGMLLTETNGTWEPAVEASLPFPYAGGDFASVSCGAPGNCSIAGAFLLNQVAGSWEAAVQIPVPANVGPYPDSWLNAVSCAAAEECTAVGYYRDSSGTEQGLIVTETP